MSVKVERKVGGAWRTMSGATGGAVAPDAPNIVGAVPGYEEVTVSWVPPADTGGSPLTGHVVVASPGGAQAAVAGAATTATVTGLTNDVAYTFVVTTSNAVGSTASAPSASVTPAAGFLAKPDVTNTGVPIGLPGDPRTSELGSLTPAPTTSAGRLTLKAINSGTTYDHVDFRNVLVTPENGTTNITFNRCLFGSSTPKTWLVQMLGLVDGLTFTECTIDGTTNDPYWPVGTFLSVAGTGNPPNQIPAGSKNITFDRCNMFHLGDCLAISTLEDVLIDRCFLHSPITDRHTNHEDYNQWNHTDAVQIAGSYGRNFSLKRSTLRLWASPNASPDTNPYNKIGQDTLDVGGSGCFQLGSMIVPREIENVEIVDNWLDGGTSVMNINDSGGIVVAGYFRIQRNKIGLRYLYVVAPTTLRDKLTVPWNESENVWAESGITKNGAGVQVVEGALVP